MYGICILEQCHHDFNVIKLLECCIGIEQGEVTYAEWKVLTREAAMTREQNELLLRQTKLNQGKLNELHTAYQTRCKHLAI